MLMLLLLCYLAVVWHTHQWPSSVSSRPHRSYSVVVVVPSLPLHPVLSSAGSSHSSAGVGLSHIIHVLTYKEQLSYLLLKPLHNHDIVSIHLIIFLSWGFATWYQAFIYSLTYHGQAKSWTLNLCWNCRKCGILENAGSSPKVNNQTSNSMQLLIGLFEARQLHIDQSCCFFHNIPLHLHTHQAPYWMHKHWTERHSHICMAKCGAVKTNVQKNWITFLTCSPCIDYMFTMYRLHVHHV